MVIGYTDRSVRLYSWSNAVNANLIAQNNANNGSNQATSQNSNQANPTNTTQAVQESGRFVLEQSWEMTDQVILVYLYQKFS